jgi:flavin reductase (DIM6/NTAB) family NADH-FMN oxidoreductase RutF
MDSDLIKATRLVPCPVVLLSVGDNDVRDVMTATAMFVSENPPLFNVSIARHIMTYELLEKSGEFVLNIPSQDQAQLAKQLGAVHGRDVDKFEKFSLETETAVKVKAPLIKKCFANIECKVITSYPASTYTVYLGAVVAYKSDPHLSSLVWMDNKYFALEKPLDL